MNVWFFNQYAEPPDGQWTATHELAKHLVKRGHEVTVFASSIDHYTRTDTRLSGRRWSDVQHFDGVRFVLLKTVAYQRNDWRRFVNMTSYAVNALRVGLHLHEQPDVIVGSSPHPFAALTACILAPIKRSRFFFELRDLWPEFFVETGVLSKRNPIVPVFRHTVGVCLRRAERVVTVWPRMDDYIEERGVPRAKVLWMPIGLDLSQHDGHGLETRAEGIGARFVAMYRGGFGRSNDVKTILDAAGELQSRGQDRIVIVLAGEGTARQEMVDHARALSLRNVEFEDFVPKHELNCALARADVLLCCLPGLPHFQKYGQIATKLLDYLASGRPTIIATNNQDNLIRRAHAGVVVPPAEPRALAAAIVQLAAMSPAERARIGRNGVQYVRQHHDIATLVDRFEGALCEVGK
jgi:glycosyltransferase involved in cell wall biosynthesis